MATPGAETLAAEILARLEADPKKDTERDALILAALEGEAALTDYLDDGTEPARPKAETAASTGAGSTATTQATKEPPGAYLKAITVEGFRGIGPRKTLDLPPGPGLTLVVGRNGSGKSSFAEALELLLTGETYRWKKPRTAVWREGWRNLHHPKAAIEAEFYVEGDKPTKVVSEWQDGADLAAAETYAQALGKKQMPVSELGWAPALSTYQPILSYNELGSMLDQGPSKLFDALSAILGLDELTVAQDTLAEARKTRDKAAKEAGETRDELLERLKALDDDRARTLVPAMENKKDWGLDAVEAAIAQSTTSATQESDLQVLRQLASLASPAQEAVATAVRDLREAEAQKRATAGTLAARSQQLAEILGHALRFHQTYGDGDCPVCGKKGALDPAWHDQQAKEAEHLKAAAHDATVAQQTADAARKRALALPTPTQETLAKAATVGLDATAATQALAEWRDGFTNAADLDALAAHIETTAPALDTATAALRNNAAAELQRREDRWKPIALDLAAWLPEARQTLKSATARKALKTAESWLKDATAEIRNARFAPIKGNAQALWNKLRLQSNVALEDIQLTGSATKRQVDLKVKVDHVEGAALGVMSQGELNALALSLFIPRATLPGSPFRFVVIDDPVQSMDPSRVDGLARVLHDTAQTRQVVVFTHDDRLPEAIRRLSLPATVFEVTRREASVVELRPSKNPVARYIEDAMALAYTDALPPQAARRVIPGLCRLAIEAACTEAIRRRRLSRGEPHAQVEELLAGLNGTKARAALALFDDHKRGDQVMGRINTQNRTWADSFRAANEGAHELQEGRMVDLVRNSEKLAGWLQAQA